MSNIKNICKLLGVAGAMSLFAGAASAADLGGSIKDGPVGYSSAYNWTGLYVGTHAGLSLGRSNAGVPGYPITNTDIDLDGAIYGGQVGYNLQRDRFVFGIEGTFSGANVEGNSNCLLIATCKSEMDWTASLVGRAGVAFDRTLVYSLAGVTWADVTAKAGVNLEPLLPVSARISGSETLVGWVVGFGIEHALTDRISAKIEYTHADYGSETVNARGSYNLGMSSGSFSAPVKLDAETDTIKLGLNIKLSN